MTEVVWLSLQVAGGSALIGLPLGTAAGWWLARRRTAARAAADALLQVPLVLPPLCMGWLLLAAFGERGPLGWLWRALGVSIPFTKLAAVLAALAVSLPLIVRAAEIAFAAVDRRLEEAARTLGAGEWDLFWSVSLPLAARGVIAGTLLAFARGLGEFGATILFAGSIPGRTRTISLAIFHYFSAPGGEDEVRALMAVAIAVSLAATVGARFLLRGTERR